MGTSNIADSFSTASLPCCNSIGYQLSDNSVDFSQELVYVLDKLFLRTKHGSISVDMLMAKTLEHRGLKAQCCARKSPAFDTLVFGVQCIQSEFCDRCSLKRKLLRKIIHTF
jgi:hypothetical protein